jgi:hypothetical protein
MRKNSEMETRQRFCTVKRTFSGPTDSVHCKSHILNEDPFTYFFFELIRHFIVRTPLPESSRGFFPPKEDIGYHFLHLSNLPVGPIALQMCTNLVHKKYWTCACFSLLSATLMTLRTWIFRKARHIGRYWKIHWSLMILYTYENTATLHCAQFIWISSASSVMFHRSLIRHDYFFTTIRLRTSFYYVCDVR